ncbi:MAG: hypothetical protein OEW89_08985 [Gammaproteobacteria bacterium]|nr:hypothetical protein [Gammaproteobacteria bacterium]
MADIPIINPTLPGWPVQPTDKSGERKKKPDDKKKQKKNEDKKRGDETSGFDEYA